MHDALDVLEFLLDFEQLVGFRGVLPVAEEDLEGSVLDWLVGNQSGCGLEEGFTGKLLTEVHYKFV